MNIASTAQNNTKATQNFKHFSLSYFLLASVAIHILILINWVKPEVITKPTEATIALKISNYLPPANKTKTKKTPPAPIVKKQIQKKIIPAKIPTKKIIKKPTPVKTQEVEVIEQVVAVPQETVVAAAVAEVPQQTVTISESARTNYENILARWLARHKRYPSHAQRRKLTGTGLLAVTIDTNGNIIRHQLSSSTGHEILDEAIIAMLKRAEPLPVIPAEFERSTYDFRVPVSFELK